MSTSSCRINSGKQPTPVESRLRVLVAENVPSLNKGEMTILEGMVRAFESVGGADIAVLSTTPDVDRARYRREIDVVDINRLFPFHKFEKSIIVRLTGSFGIVVKHIPFLILYRLFGRKAIKVFRDDFWRTIIDSDVIIIGHDGSFSPGAGVGHPIMFYPLILPLFARMLPRKTVLFGGSIPNLSAARFGLGGLLKLSLQNICLITLRERISRDYAEKAGIDMTKTVVTADPAFLMEPACVDEAMEIMRSEGLSNRNRPIIGMTVTKKRACNAYPNIHPRESYRRHLDMLAETIENSTKSENATFVLIPHCIGPGLDSDDRQTSLDLKKRCKTKGSVVVIEREYSARELKALIGQFDLMIGERFHSVVNAISMGTPSIILCQEDDQRLDIIRMLKHEHAIVNVTNLGAETLSYKINETLTNGAMIRDMMRVDVHRMEDCARFNAQLLMRLIGERT